MITVKDADADEICKKKWARFPTKSYNLFGLDRPIAINGGFYCRLGIPVNPSMCCSLSILGQFSGAQSLHATLSRA